ncbi:MAG: hypothetical protein HRT61_11680 [Ekhidna sp.]|nr:hypothetical protein [Ekhidna sp.]
MSKSQDLTEGSIPKRLIQLTLPMMVGIISMVAFNLIDTYFVGKLGNKELLDLSLTFLVIIIVFRIMQWIGIQGTILKKFIILL